MQKHKSYFLKVVVIDKIHQIYNPVSKIDIL